MMPLDLRGQGRIHVRSGGGARTIEGRLGIVGGSMTVGGRAFALERGEVRFDAEHPSGWFDLWLARPPHVAALRDLSLASSAGDDIKLNFVGPYGQQQLVFEGSAHALFDALAMNTLGRTRWYSQPGTPASNTAQLPQYGQIRQSAYMVVNLPHLAFLDRFSSWANPYDDPSAYGRLRHLEGEHYPDRSRRVRVTARPRTTGQSELEVEYDWLFSNTSRIISGFGVRGGTRAGGGPGVFLEWSSAD
jgi:hypothetical protein